MTQRQVARMYLKGLWIVFLGACFGGFCVAPWYLELLIVLVASFAWAAEAAS